MHASSTMLTLLLVALLFSNPFNHAKESGIYLHQSEPHSFNILLLSHLVPSNKTFLN
jgi:hypothetical protein